MALRCDNCGKGVMYGHNVSHSKRRTQKIFKPNLHSAKIVVNGGTKRLKLCTKCLRQLKEKPNETKMKSAIESAPVEELSTSGL